ncbi:glycosyltransferase family 4 protein [Parasphingorhabdus flavimaris]|uniref:glycosyltransferase family 4 protein n=1 Tax=Parasphingorhabdus flavimaris TaxID=266812 RepID=UPI003002227B
MKILYVHQHFSTPAGAAGTRSYEMASRLIAAGHEVTMVCGSNNTGKTGVDSPFFKGKRQGLVDGIKVIEFDLSYDNKNGFLRRSILFLKFALRSVGVALREPVDIVFATSTPLTAGIPGIAAKWIRRKPFIFEVRDLWPELPRAMGVITNPVVLWAMGLLEWVSYKSADRLIGLSPGIVEGISRHVPDHNKIALVPNGCDSELFSDNVERWRPAEVSDRDFMAIFTGTHGQANGLTAVIDAAAILNARDAKGIKLVLVGDGAEKASLMNRVEKAGLEHIVIFHDPVPKTRLVGLLASADLGLQILADVPAFYYGTSPNKFFDYLAAGLPVITNYPGWIADLVEQYQCGIAVPAADPNLFATALIKMANTSEIDRRSMMGQSKRLAEEQFHRDRLFSKFSKHLLGI